MYFLNTNTAAHTEIFILMQALKQVPSCNVLLVLSLSLKSFHSRHANKAKALVLNQDQWILETAHVNTKDAPTVCFRFFTNSVFPLTNKRLLCFYNTY